VRRPSQHHHDLLNTGFFGQVLGMPGESNAGIIDRALLYGRGDDCIYPPIHGRVGSNVQRLQYRRTVAGIQLARHRTHGQWTIDQAESPRLARQAL
jgi:hypothetical protein